jgi:cytochrome c-type biogenesis protein CcmH
MTLHRKSRHCETPKGRRSNLAGIVLVGSRLLRSARNDAIGFTVFVALALLTTTPAYAVRPDEMLQNPALEARAEQVGRELRCLVCRNQSIEDSEADLAHDLRLLVRRRIAAGDANDQVIAYLRSRYGDYVLLRPPFEPGTLLLWAGPLLVLLLGGIVLVRFYCRPGGEPGAPPLSPDERRRLSQILGEAPEA